MYDKYPHIVSADAPAAVNVEDVPCDTDAIQVQALSFKGPDNFT